jgi:2-polyprenyl-3-methyl-5-hydroxy-6-metoxy-1,4-benzoquinol methylase
MEEMMISQMETWERAEVMRSAFEAAHIHEAALRANEDDLKRYMNPPADTCYPLEYAYHLLGDARGKLVLDYGCGDGIHSLTLARRGARVKSLDISPELIHVARQRLRLNGIDSGVEFINGSAHEIPLPDESVDVVFGIAILHHLDLALSSREVHRVLKPGGRAIFQEPVRNSRFMKTIRGLIPYRSPGVSPYERPLTDCELQDYAQGFSSYRTKAFLLPTTNLVDVIPPLSRRYIHTCYRRDANVLRRFPKLAFYSTVRVIEIVK